MLSALRKIFHRESPESPTHSPEGFPLNPPPFWYGGAWQSYRYDELQKGRTWRSDHTPWPIEGKIMFNYRYCADAMMGVGDNSRGLVDGLIPAMRLGDLVGLYEATDRHYLQGCGPWSDFAGWDDGKEVALRFVKTCSVEDVPRLQPLPEDAKIDWEHVEIWSFHDPRRPKNGELIQENMYSSHWIDVTVVVVGLGREWVNMPWGRAEVPEADDPVVRSHEEHASEGHPMRDRWERDDRPVLELIPEGQDPHEYAEKRGGVVAYGTYIPEGFTRGGNNRNWRSHAG